MSDELSKMSREELQEEHRIAYVNDSWPRLSETFDELTRRLAAVEADRDHWKARAEAAEGLLEKCEKNLVYLWGEPPELDDEWEAEHSLTAEIRMALAARQPEHDAGGEVGK